MVSELFSSSVNKTLKKYFLTFYKELEAVILYNFWHYFLRQSESKSERVMFILGFLETFWCAWGEVVKEQVFRECYSYITISSPFPFSFFKLKVLLNFWGKNKMSKTCFQKNCNWDEIFVIALHIFSLWDSVIISNILFIVYCLVPSLNCSQENI